MSVIHFDHRDLGRALDSLSVEELDALAFGVIKLDRQGRVEIYSKTERAQSGMKSRPTVGLDFFVQIAPCMNEPAFRGRIEAARAAGRIDVEIGWIGDFADRDRELTIRAVSASDGGLWICLSREVHAAA